MVTGARSWLAAQPAEQRPARMGLGVTAAIAQNPPRPSTCSLPMPLKIRQRKSSIHGNGVFALAAIAEGERIIEYKGELRSHDEVDGGDAGDVESGHTFLFTLNDEWVIDGTRKGNVARWINHSCAPNCQALIVEHAHDRRRDKVVIEALRPIAEGEELTYNYGIRLAERHTARLKKIWACHCGAASCTGTLLQPKR